MPDDAPDGFWEDPDRNWPATPEDVPAATPEWEAEEARRREEEAAALAEEELRALAATDAVANLRVQILDKRRSLEQAMQHVDALSSDVAALEGLLAAVSPPAP